MWIAILIWLYVASFRGHAQVSTRIDYVTATQSPIVVEGLHLNGTQILSDDDSPSDVGNAPQNKTLQHAMLHLTRWRPVDLPMYFNPYKEQNLRSIESEEVSDKQSKTPSISSESDMNKTVSTTANHTGEQYPVFSDSINHYPHPFVQNQLPTLMMSPILYPNAMSINLRSHTTNIREAHNSTNSVASISVTEPVASNYEEKYTQILPNFPLPTIPIPPNSVFPFDRLRDQHIFYPLTAPFYFKPYAIPPTIENIQEFDREASSKVVENAFSEQRLSDVEKPVPAADPQTPVVNAPFGLPTFVRPASSGRFPFLRIPSIISPSPNQTARVSPLKPYPLPGTVDVPKAINAAEYFPEQVPIKERFISNTTSSPQEDFLSESPETEIIENGEEKNASENIKTSRIPYEFGYHMNDGNGTDQHRTEVSDVSGVVRGSYGYRDMFGVYRLVNYIADKKGFRAFVKSNEPGIASSESADVIVIAENAPSVPKAAKVREPGSIVADTLDLTQKKMKEADKHLREEN